MQSDPISQFVVYADDPELLGLGRKPWFSSKHFLGGHKKVMLCREAWNWLRTNKIKYHVGYYCAPESIRKDSYRWRLLVQGNSLKDVWLENAFSKLMLGPRLPLKLMITLIPGISFENKEDLLLFKLTWL